MISWLVESVEGTDLSTCMPVRIVVCLEVYFVFDLQDNGKSIVWSKIMSCSHFFILYTCHVYE